MKNFIKYLFVMLAVMTAMAIISCQKPEIIIQNEDTEEQKTVDQNAPTVTLYEKDVIIYPASTGEEVKVSFTLNFYKEGDTFEITVPEGVNHTVEMTTKARGKLILTCSDEFEKGKVVITVSNEKGTNKGEFAIEKAFIKANIPYFETGYKETESTFSVESNVAYKVECADEWISVSQKSGNIYEFGVGTNKTEASREGAIVLKDEKELFSTVIPVRQAVVDNPLRLLTDRELMLRIMEKQIAAGWKDSQDSLHKWSPDLPLEYWPGVELATIYGGEETVIIYNFTLQDGMEMQIPEEIGFLSNLKELRIFAPTKACYSQDEYEIYEGEIISAHLYGELPESFMNLTKLVRLDIHDCYVRGEIPYFIKNITTLKFLQIKNTKISGPLPAFLAEMNIENAWFTHCRFHGEIPDEILNCDWWTGKGYEKYGRNNRLGMLIAGQQTGYRLWVRGYEDIEKYPWGFDNDIYQFDVEEELKAYASLINWKRCPWEYLYHEPYNW